MPSNNPTRQTKISNTPTPAPTYAALVRLIKKEIEQGLKDIRYRQVLIYWRTGRFIHQYILHGADHAEYGEHLYEHLEEELPFKADTLQRTVQFFKEFPNEFSIQAPGPKLGWKHYRALMTVADLDQRKILHTKAIKENLNVRQLQHLVSKENSKTAKGLSFPNALVGNPQQIHLGTGPNEALTGPPTENLPAGRQAFGGDSSGIRPKTVHKKFKFSPEGIPQLPVERGFLYTYKVIAPTSLQTPPGFIVVDCGFEQWFEVETHLPAGKAGCNASLPPEDKFKAGDIIESTKTPDHRYTMKKSSRSESDLFTFQARLERIVDADTFIFHVDCGFHLWNRQRLRLRHINCPELSTPEGKKAKRFIEETIQDCPFCIIKTYLTDKYARYLVDIFYLPNEDDPAKVASEGRLLNQELLNARLAEIW